SVVQTTTSALKGLAFAALIVAAFALGTGGGAASTTPPGDVALFTAFVLSLQAVIYTYDGWTGVIYFSEEVEWPDRDIPRSLIGGVLAIIATYVLVNLAFLYV